LAATRTDTSGSSSASCGTSLSVLLTDERVSLSPHGRSQRLVGQQQLEALPERLSAMASVIATGLFSGHTEGSTSASIRA
jgi:hypothetical protein